MGYGYLQGHALGTLRGKPHFGGGFWPPRYIRTVSVCGPLARKETGKGGLKPPSEYRLLGYPEVAEMPVPGALRGYLIYTSLELSSPPW